LGCFAKLSFNLVEFPKKIMEKTISKADSGTRAAFTRSGIPMDVFLEAKQYSDNIVAERRKYFDKLDAKDALSLPKLKRIAKVR
jgi:hypothetical protein